ncbi:chymotrypsinogen A-like isoform X2 [Prorops nasuta]|uniref:chymotrypsinogen A-like isoform X2 n=1 Tax=Prorops nasuta TaxID=863751 RepID=UPI0034CEC293
MIMATTVLCLLALVAASQALPYGLRPQIYYGQIAAKGQFPYQVSIAKKTKVWMTDQCGGTIINENYVLTSALCLQRTTDIEDLVVIAGTIDTSNMTYAYKVEKVINHPLVNFGTKQNDIALLKLKKSFDKVPIIQSVALPTKNDSFKIGDVAIVSGWGRNWGAAPQDRQLRYASLVISDLHECKKIYENKAYKVHDTNVCAYDRGTVVSPCIGDEGGPLTVNGKLVGIVSWGNWNYYHCSTFGDFPSVYTSVFSYLGWIKENAV